MFGTRQKKLALLLGATAAGWSMGAAANIDFGATTDDPVMIQSETPVPATGTTITGVLEAGVNDMDVVSEIGFGFPVNGKVYFRYDISNGVIGAGGLTAANLTDGGGDLSQVVVSDGGAAGDNFVVYSATVANAAGIAQTQTITLALGGAGITVDDQNEVSIIYGVYETLISAVNNSSPVGQFGPEPVIVFAPGITVTEAAATSVVSNDGANTGIAQALVAEVENDFLNFGNDTANGGAYTVARVGSVTVANGATRAATAAAAGIAAYGPSTLTINGDFNLALDNITDMPSVYSLANVRLQLQTAGAAFDCTSTAAANAFNSINATSVTADTATFTIDPANDFGGAGLPLTYAVCVDSLGDNAILRASYTSTFDGAAAAGTTNVPLTGDTGALGSITRNGVVVQLPYLTDFEDYNQRVIIVNRNASAVEIAGITFLPEEGTTVTNTMSADDMMIPANGMKVLLVRDMIDTEGTTRTAASLSIVAKAGTVDVATQQVNLNDGTTDTAEYTDN